MSEPTESDPDNTPQTMAQATPPQPPPAELPAATASVRKVDPLHAITLEAILTSLVGELGWDELGNRIRVNCFVSNPSITSSLKFLRKTPWARQKVEALYISMLKAS